MTHSGEHAIGAVGDAVSYVEHARPDERVRPWLRPLLIASGCFWVVLGVAGIFLPLIPTTGPLLFATFLFAKSSPRLHHWLTTHPRFGRFVSDFHEGRGIPLRGKVIATIAMIAAFSYTIYWRLPKLWMQVVVAGIAGWALWFVHKYPTAPRGDEPAV